MTSAFAEIQHVIDGARNGRMFVLVDDRENESEGNLVIPAQMATPDTVNFMATHGRGLICLALTQKRIDQLNLPLMAKSNGSRSQTAFTVSIESKHGVTTGISAGDRARTIATAINEMNGIDEIVSPGHVFPLAARDGGVLMRAGHAEAGIDISTLAGLNPSAVICQIMNDDGTVARLDDLQQFSKRHDLKIASISDLIAYRRRTEQQVERVASTRVQSHFGGTFDVMVYRNKIDLSEHLVLSVGRFLPEKAMLVRMHALNVFSDVIDDAFHGGTGSLEASMRMIAAAGHGAVVILRPPRADVLSAWISEHAHAEDMHSTGELRDYGLGAQILCDLGVKKVRLISGSPRIPVGLEGFGFEIVEQVSLPAPNQL
jgi:3,4-dihydroxy 2-butanone 4-phosphate synthase / GTP cyclohydrolase II